MSESYAGMKKNANLKIRIYEFERKLVKVKNENHQKSDTKKLRERELEKVINRMIEIETKLVNQNDEKNELGDQI